MPGDHRLIMNRGSYAAASVLFSGLAAASFILVTFNTGWIIRELDDMLYVVLLACALLVPLVAMLIANVSDRVRRALMLALLGLFEACSYIVATTMQNSGFNTSFIFNAASITWYSLMLGSALSIMMVSLAELGKVSRSVPAWPMLACMALAVPGAFMAASLAAGFSGWVQNVLLAMILQPAGLLIFPLGSPRGDETGAAALLEPAELRPAHVVHPLKGGFLTLFYLLNGANLALLVGVNGMGLAPSFFAHENVMFYASTGLGVAAGSGISFVAARKLLLAPGSFKKDRDASLFLLGALAVQLILWLAAISPEILCEGFHGSAAAQLVDGTAVGAIMSLHFAVALVHHPPRGLVAHVMLQAFCTGAFLVVGQVLKAISLGSDGIKSLQEYLPWVLWLELVIVLNIVLLVAIPAIGKQARQRKLREREGETK